MPQIVVVVDEARADDERDAIVAALAKSNADVRAVRGAPASAPEGDAWIVSAEDLDALAAGSSFASRAERTLVLNAPRTEVLDLLEKHGLAGALECDGPDGWTGPPRMFVRKEAVESARGEVVGGRGRESARYTLWRASDGSLAEMVSAYASLCVELSHRDDKLLITADDARAHGLPPVGIEFIVGRTGMFPQTFSGSGTFVSMVSPPGGGPGFSVQDSRGRSLEEIIATESGLRHNQPFHASAIEDVDLARRKCRAVACSIGDGFFRYATCYVLAEPVLLTFSRRWPTGEPTVASVLADPSLAIIARSIRLG
jgi:hypothetical protein